MQGELTIRSQKICNLIDQYRSRENKGWLVDQIFLRKRFTLVYSLVEQHTQKLTNTPAVIFSYTFRGRWFIFTNQFLLYYIEQIESLFTATFRSSSKQVLLKFCTIHLKTPQLEYLFNQPEPATYLIRDSDTDAFLWILWNHQEHHFYKTPWGSCFWIYGTYLQHHKTYS